MFASHVIIPVRAAARRIVDFFQPEPVEEDARWQAFAYSLPPGRFVVWLANDVTTGIIYRRFDPVGSHYGVNRQMLVPLQGDAERFLRHYYGRFHFHGAQCRVVGVFRALVQHKLRHIDVTL